MNFLNGFLESNVGTFLLGLALGVVHSLVGFLSSSHGLLEGLFGSSNFLCLLGVGLFGLSVVRFFCDGFWQHVSWQL